MMRRPAYTPARWLASIAAAAGAVLTLTLMPAWAGPALAGPQQVARAPAGPATDPQELVDGLAAIVNGEVISIGEVRRAARIGHGSPLSDAAGACDLLSDAPASNADTPTADANPGAGPDAAERNALECLIDRTLVYREVRRFPQLDVPAQQVTGALESIVASFPDRDQFDRELRRSGLTLQEVRADLTRQLLIANYIDSRFRATVDITLQDAQRLWTQDLVPDMRAKGIPVPDFDSVAADYVIPLLREREVNRRVQSWITDLRGRAQIRRIYP